MRGIEGIRSRLGLYDEALAAQRAGRPHNLTWAAVAAAADVPYLLAYIEHLEAQVPEPSEPDYEPLTRARAMLHADYEPGSLMGKTRAMCLDDPDGPYAEITRVGRWTYSIRIVDGIGVYGDWRILGRHRAGQEALRVLADYRRRNDPKDITIVT